MLPKAVFATLTSTSQKALLSKVTPVYKKVYAHHVTLVYAPKEDDINDIEEFVVNGEKVVIRLGRRFWSKGVEAIEAKVFTAYNENREVPIKNEKPHITISTDNKPPVLSNDMLAGKGEFNDGFEGAQLIGGDYEATVEYIYKF